MTTTVRPRRAAPTPAQRGQTRASGFALLLAIVSVMWLVEIINSLDNGGLDGDGLYPRNFDRLWGILTFPFIHASFGHLFDNTIPFLFLGAFIALRGAARLGFITAFVILVGGLGTWLVSPAYPPTVGASGVVFGYAAYLLARGFFDRRLWELVVGGIVAVIWGAALIASLVPHTGISWQAHLCGGIAGILAAWILSTRDRRARRGWSRMT
ncbi:MAG TPA: rhomboid family intramembrane serine protease [Solirubrobacteraceae bacterium]|jgi:membrane associated rhomboid family serine protease|nr:rhomboid family intramembrane serine protease [Solirubrobacteraceae bacterium]